MKSGPYFTHLRKIEDKIIKLELRQAIIFGTLCIERQWPIYDRACKGKDWSEKVFFREVIDKVWESILNGSKVENDITKKCEEAIHEDANDDSEIGARSVAVNIFGLASIVECGKKDEIITIADSNLILLDSFLYEYLKLPVSNESDLIIQTHELMSNEMERQINDLSELNDFLTSELINKLREKSIGKGILADYWYV